MENVQRHQEKKKLFTLQKTNMELKNAGLEDDFAFQRGDLQVPAVSFMESNLPYPPASQILGGNLPTPPFTPAWLVEDSPEDMS